MMAIADLAVVTDAPALVAELARRLRPAPGGCSRCLTCARDDRRPTPDFDVIVVGAGPAGSAAALVLARAGRRVCLLERGPFPGSKNMYGGVVYGRVLDTLIPGWWEEAPMQRWVTRRGTMIMTETQALTVDYRTDGLGRGALQRRHHVPARLRRLAGRQGGRGRRGARAPRPRRPACCATRTGRITGVRTDRPDGDLTRPARHRLRRRQLASWPRRPASTRTRCPTTSRSAPRRCWPCPARRSRSASGCAATRAPTSRSSAARRASPAAASSTPTSTRVAVGVVLSVTELAKAKVRPEELIAGLKAPPGGRAAGRGRASSRSTRPTSSPRAATT